MNMSESDIRKRTANFTTEEGIGNVYDCDAVNKENEATKEMCIEENVTSPCGNSELTSVEVVIKERDWSQHDPLMLQQPVSKELQLGGSTETAQSSSNGNMPCGSKHYNSKSRSYTPSQRYNKKWLLLAERKTELVEMKKKFLQEEHQMKIKNLKELHDVQMQILKLELEKKRRELEIINI